MASGQVGHDAREDDERDAVADAALGDLLTQPHEEGGARGEREHGHGAERPARLVDDVTGLRARLVERLEEQRDADALREAQGDGAVARVLVELALASLALLAELLEGLHHDREQRDDDARRHVGHDVQREDGHLLERAAREQVEHPQEAVAGAVDVLPHRVPVDPGCGHENSNAIHRQHPQSEEDAAT
jgi:hypothetical protein